jgi:hypothetical protein
MLPLSTATSGGQMPETANSRRPIAATAATLETMSRTNTTALLGVFRNHVRKPSSAIVGGSSSTPGADGFSGSERVPSVDSASPAAIGSSDGGCSSGLGR